MATVTIEDLREAAALESYMLFAVDTPDETFNVPLSVLLQYITEKQNPTPTGSIILWPSESIPLGYTELDGKSFDTQVYPGLGELFPSGVLPDTRGMVLKHQKDGRVILSYEADAIKSHNHTAQSSTSIANDSHSHTKGSMRIVGQAGESSNDNYAIVGARSTGNYSSGAMGTRITKGVLTINYLDDEGSYVEVYIDTNQGGWTGSTSTDTHNHSATTNTTINNNGGSENLVKNVAVKFIVKRA